MPSWLRHVPQRAGTGPSRGRTGHQVAHLRDAVPPRASPLATASPAWESKSFGSTRRRGRESRCAKALAGLYLGHQLRYLQMSVRPWPCVFS